MAVRPFSFGARLRHGDRTVRVRHTVHGYAVEDSAAGRAPRRRLHADLASALRDVASTWRGRLH